MDAGRAGGSGLSGRNAVGKPGGDDGRALGAEAADAEAVQGAGAPRLDARRGARRRRARRRRAVQVNAFGSLLTPFFTASPVRDYDSALRANTERLRDVLPRHAGAGHLSAAVAVRGVVPVGRAHRPRTSEDDRRGGRGDEGGREEDLKPRDRHEGREGHERKS